ncbi:hypothetical protein BCV72DRAFT_214484 [Rhizopus microsporus var. microsporus]|uniref:Uncharacterized protein n=1 Tax=Rhizopus microsporus var. microsporus TaxID=86635 RepID=A0A1X0QSW2_RHIZD|nr:hypothetical protein BCV72DRAFT_214484 [Rhizopus microsporus var. microsporus]
MFTKAKRYLEKRNMVSDHLEFDHWSDIDPSVGTFPVLVDNSWRLDSGNQTYDCLVYIIPSHVKPLKEMNNVFSDYPSPIHINLARNVYLGK